MGEPETATLGLDETGVPTGAAEPLFLPREIAAHRFRIRRLLGQGGMAQVFEAEDLELHQDVAIKVLRPEIATESRARDLVRREVLLSRRVTHPNVCRIFDVFQHSAAAGDRLHPAAARPARIDRPESDMLLLVMELVRGETLARRLARGGALTAFEALPIVRQLAEALDAAHRSHVVHGDFKSSNVLLEPSPGGVRAVVTDFGLAQSTAVGFCAGGTSAYMAPEQKRGELGEASDVYALGVVIYEMVAGRRPRPGPACFARGAWPPELPPSWSAVVASCLAPSPRDRPRSAAEVVRRLAGSLPAAPRSPAPRRLQRVRVGGGLALALACLALAPADALRRRSPAATTPPATPIPAPRLTLSVGTVHGASAAARYPWLPATLGHLLFTELAAADPIEAFQVPPEPAAPALHPGDFTAVTSFVVSGKAGEDRDATIQVEQQLRRTASGELLLSARESAPLAELPALAARLGDRLRGALGMGEAAPQDRTAALALRPATLRAEGFYAVALAHLLRERYQDAEAPLLQAVALEPDFAPAHAALARVCSELGYDQRARREALSARRRSSLLPERQRLEIEAISRGLNGDPIGAAGLFGALWHAAPHHFDYGVQLAEAQAAAGRARESLETLQRIRSRGRGFAVAQGPGLDNLEAAGRYNLSELEASLAAALAAEAKARQAGDPFALARALLGEAAARIDGGNGDGGPAIVQASALYRRLGYRVGEARALSAASSLAGRSGTVQRAVALEDRALSLFVAEAASGSVARTRVDKAMNLRLLGRQREALPILERAAADFRSLGDRYHEAIALGNLALLETETGKPKEAKRHYLDAAARDSELGNREGLAAVLTNLATVEIEDDDLASARGHFQEALRISEEIGSRKGQAFGHINVGCLRAVEGDLRAARPELWKALRLAREIDDRFLEAHALGSLGPVLVDEGNLPLAESTIRQALTLEAGNAEAEAVPVSLLDLARLEMRASRFPAAEASARQSLAEQERLKARPRKYVPALSYLAMALVGEGNLEKAEHTLEAAGRDATATADPATALVLALARARLALARRRPDDAVRALDPTLQRFSRTPNPDLVLEGRLLLATSELAAGRTAGACRDLRSLAAATERQGFLFLAGEARRLLGTPDCRPPAVTHG